LPRKGKRVRVMKGVYRDSGGYEIRVVVGGHPYYDRAPLDATRDELRTQRAALANKGHTTTPPVKRGTLAADAPRYLKLVSHLASVDDREDHLNRWIALYGDVPRHRLTVQDVIAARVAWLDEGLSPKTINHYVGTLRNLYTRLDGKSSPSPCDDVAPLPVPKTIIHRVSDALIRSIDENLQRRERDRTKQFDGNKTRARFRVLVSTGKRPCEVMRAQPSDVNLEARVWVPRDAKGGYCPGVYLNDDMLAAWQLFIQAGAWGPFSPSNYGRVIRKAGWPAGVRPYQARHATWIAASERGADLADIATGAGHKDIRLTRRVYVPILNSRMQQLSERLDGRFGGFPVVPESGSSAAAPKTLAKSRGRARR
jgi:integrase